MTMRVSSVEETMPPIIGTAMRCMTSEPVPVLHMIGRSPAMMATTVIIFGRTRSTAPIMIACRDQPACMVALLRHIGRGSPRAAWSR